jgi:hypothetical protein
MFNIDFNAENKKKTVVEYVDRLIEKANKLKKTSESLNKTLKILLHFMVTQKQR